jgi:hypothetical protein
MDFTVSKICFFKCALYRYTSAAPQAVLGHALRWIDLLVADLKGRGAALRRSRRRLQKVKAGLYKLFPCYIW